MTGFERRPPKVVPVLCAAIVLIVGCGEEEASESTGTVAPRADGGLASDPQPTELPPLADEPKRRGEIAIEGLKPQSFGPFEATGPYRLRFQQAAGPADGIGALVVATTSHPGDRPIDVLVNTTDRSGRYELYLKGRIFIDVSVADSGYAVRLTPL